MVESNIQIRLRENELKPCKVNGCNSPRHGFSAYCARHKSAFTRFGHPEGYVIRLHTYRDFQDIITRYLAYQWELGEDRILQDAIEFFDAWYQSCREIDKNVSQDGSNKILGCPVIVELIKNNRHELPNMLAQLCALYSYWADRQTSNLPASAFHYNLGIVIAKAANAYNRQDAVPGKELRNIGRYALQGLKPLFLKTNKYRINLNYREKKTQQFSFLRTLRITDA